MKRKKWAALLLSGVMAVSTVFGGMAFADTEDVAATPGNAGRKELEISMDVSKASSNNALMTVKEAEESDYAKIKDMTLHIISPETKTATVDELTSSAIRVFVFGDLKSCTNTMNVMELLTHQLEGIDAEIYYLDIKGRSADEILQRENILSKNVPYFLCEDKDGEYKKQYFRLCNGGIMPLVFVVGREQETIYLSSYPSSYDYDEYVRELRKKILEAYPEEINDIYLSTDYVYMCPGTKRYVPVMAKDGFTYSSDKPEVADVEQEQIVAKSPGMAKITISFGDKSAVVFVQVLAPKEDYKEEREVLKIVNAQRIKEGLLPLSTTEKYQMAGDIRAYELGDLYKHQRPDGSNISTVSTEVGIISPAYIAENIAYGQRNAIEVMIDWMNSPTHRTNILSPNNFHIGVGVQSYLWVQYFGNCKGTYEEISLVTKEDSPAILIEGETISDLDYELRLVCSCCGESRMPIIDEMCKGFEANKTGLQEITVSYEDWSATFSVIVAENNAVQNVTLSPKALFMIVGTKAVLTPNIFPQNVEYKTLTWHSTDPEVASVNENGCVTAVSKGMAEVYCVVEGDNYIIESEHCPVIVVLNNTEKPEETLVQLIRILPESLSMKVGKTSVISKIVLPVSADNKAVSWHSTNPEVASVDENGTVTAVSKGTAEIYCVAQDEGKKESNHCKVTVEEDEKQPEKPTVKLVESIKVSPETLSVKTGEQVSVSGTVSPEDADYKEVSWYSTNPEVASVDENGVVTAVSEGTAEIYCVAKDEGKKESNHCKVTVEEDEKQPEKPTVKLVESIKVSPETLSMKKGENGSVSGTISPEDADHKEVSWHSTNPEVASVDENGVVTAVSEGTAEIYCVAKDEGKKESNHCKVTVEEDNEPEKPTVKLVESIKVSPETLSMKKGENGSVSGTISPEDADYKAVSWHSTNPEVASVDENGAVTAVSEGTAEIYCTAQDDGKVESSRCVVTVEPADEKVLVQSITVSSSSITLSVKSSRTLTASVRPENAEDSSVTWHSTDSAIASVDENGKVTAVARGTAEIYCVSKDGGNIESNHCTVKVTSASSGGSGGGGGGGSSSGGSSSQKGTTSLPSYVIRGTWTQGGNGIWRFVDIAGKSYTSAWVAVENPYANQTLGQQPFDWFRFDEAGNMMTGWYQDPTDGYWYYMNPISDNTLGRMITGWFMIDGYYYYFNPNSDGHRGRMYINETTPDGYQVDGNGRWIP